MAKTGPAHHRQGSWLNTPIRCASTGAAGPLARIAREQIGSRDGQPRVFHGVVPRADEASGCVPKAAVSQFMPKTDPAHQRQVGWLNTPIRCESAGAAGPLVRIVCEQIAIGRPDMRFSRASTMSQDGL